MKLLSSLFLTVFLFSCAQKNDSASVDVAPVSKEDSAALRNSIIAGKAIRPGIKLDTVPAADCADFVKKLPGFTAGYLDVPEDWDQPETSPKIKVFYYWRKASDKAGENRAPVVFYNGGPGSDSHGSAQLLAPLDFTKKSAFVFFDQRGTGCSTPFPTENDEATAARLTKWGSRGIVGDSEAVRKHLFGNRKWRAYGQSYGGQITHRYIEIAPEGLDRAIIHGHSVMSDGIGWLVERIRSQQRVSENFFKEYPNAKGILAKARTQISPTRCWKMKNDSICGSSVLDSLTILLGFKSNWDSLNAWIEALTLPDGKLSDVVVDEVVKNFVFGIYGSSGLAGEVISKMELTPGYDSVAGCIETTKRLLSEGENPEGYAFNECRMFAKYESPFPALMENVRGDPVSLDRLYSVLEPAPFAFYLFSGQQDVFVPVATFAEEVQRLGKLVNYKSFPDSGHEGFYSEKDVTNAVSK